MGYLAALRATSGREFRRERASISGQMNAVTIATICASDDGHSHRRPRMPANCLDDVERRRSVAVDRDRPRAAPRPPRRTNFRKLKLPKIETVGPLRLYPWLTRSLARSRRREIAKRQYRVHRATLYSPPRDNNVAELWPAGSTCRHANEGLGAFRIVEGY